MYYVCTPVYVRCRVNRHCKQSPKICNGIESCTNKWNSSRNCIHLRRKLQTLSNDVNVVHNPPGKFIGLFFTAFLFLNNITRQIRVEKKLELISLFLLFIDKLSAN